MILSMTGFGEAQVEDEGHLYHLELRSVNNRYFKAAIHLSDDFSFLEAEVERLLRQRLARGSVTLRLHVRDLSAAAAQDLNVAALRRYVEQLSSVAEKDQPSLRIDLATLATLPGVCQPRELTQSQRERGMSVIVKLLDAAMVRLMEMRAREGKSLAEDLRLHCGRVSEHVRLIRQRAPTVVEEYRRRLHSRVQELVAASGVQLAEQDVLKEVAIYAERSDVSEELSRLAAHLEQFDSLFSSPEPAGRKMDFIAQEMLREANTIGSKSGDAPISKWIIEVKASIDRIKEQVQNAE